MAAQLPPELWDHVCSFLPADSLQHTALALSRALPATPLSPATLCRHLRISRPDQAWLATAHLRAHDDDLAAAVHSVAVRVWRDDMQLVVNLLLALHAARSIDLAVGPLASPDHLADLLDPNSLHRSARWRNLEQLALRFNPYCAERSYYTFLKGQYFDLAPLALARADPADLPALRRLSFVQDLPPTHGQVKKSVPAFGLHDLASALDDAAATGDAPAPAAPVVVPVSGKFARAPKAGHELDFAQPIVFFQLACLTRLASSPLGAQLTHVTLRLPRRNLLTALTDAPTLRRGSGQGGGKEGALFPALRHLDLSTTHVVDDARFPTLLRLYPRLETLVLDRCSGLVSREAVREATALATLRWLGKCIAGVPLSRADEALRTWRRLAKDRPTDTVPFPVRDVLVLPPAPSLRSLGLGLHSLPRTDEARAVHAEWARAFRDGYSDACERALERATDVAERWARWERSGRLGGSAADATGRVVVFREDVARLEPALRNLVLAGGEDAAEPDALFARFCAERALVPLPAASASSLVSALASASRAALADARARFVACFVPDCSDRAGVPHLSLHEGRGADEVCARARREREGWERERREEGEWRREEGEHESGGDGKGCAHVEGRRAWEVE
ncbi:uncharacterized protein JCM10292_003273 [Rhodotorula paludigena]|uniref:uncharacterized protein n=1 Tax=Rhodotorula paludigena TaxID=86838 RepID=UPI00317F45CC